MQHAFEQRCTTQKIISRVQLKVGDLVLLRVPHISNAVQNQINKFFHIYEGPYKLVKQVGSNAFVLSPR